MKKSLLSLLSALPLLAFSQTLSLKEARIEKDLNVDKARVIVTNNSSSTMEVMVKRNIVSLAPNHVTYFCWVQCYGPEMEVSPQPVVLSPGESTSLFYGDLEHYGQPGTTEVCYTFYDKNNIENKVEQCFNYAITGINTVNQDFSESLTAPYPNPAKSFSKVGYDLSNKNFESASLYIRNLAGALVKKIKIEGVKGELILSTDEMANGIYTYSLMIDEKAVLTKRLIIAN